MSRCRYRCAYLIDVAFVAFRATVKSYVALFRQLKEGQQVKNPNSSEHHRNPVRKPLGHSASLDVYASTHSID